jgi:hypothetical protein
MNFNKGTKTAIVKKLLYPRPHKNILSTLHGDWRIWKNKRLHIELG